MSTNSDSIAHPSQLTMPTPDAWQHMAGFALDLVEVLKREQSDQLACSKDDGHRSVAGVMTLRALRLGADPWQVVKALADFIESRAAREPEGDATREVRLVLSKVHALRTREIRYSHAPADAAVRYQLHGMVQDVDGVHLANEAGELVRISIDLYGAREDGVDLTFFAPQIALIARHLAVYDGKALCDYLAPRLESMLAS